MTFLWGEKYSHFGSGQFACRRWVFKDGGSVTPTAVFTPFPACTYRIQPKKTYYVAVGEAFQVGDLVRPEMVGNSLAVNCAQRESIESTLFDRGYGLSWGGDEGMFWTIKTKIDYHLNINPSLLATFASVMRFFMFCLIMSINSSSAIQQLLRLNHFTFTYKVQLDRKLAWIISQTKYCNIP